MKVGGSHVALEKEGDPGKGPQVGGLVVRGDLTFPLVAAVLEPYLDL